MEEKGAAPLAVCPHCGFEIRKEAKFCPQCGGKLRIASQCPRCEAKVEKGEKFCSNCGKDLSSEEPVTPTPRVTTPTPPLSLKRPAGITIMSILWFIGGLYNTLVGLSILASDIDTMSLLVQGYQFSDQAANTYVSWAIPLEALISLVVIMLGLTQFFTIYGFLRGRSWSYSLGIAIPIVAIITSWLHMFLQLSAPQSMDISVSFLLPLASLVGAIIYITYLRRAHVKKWLRVGTEMRVEEVPRAI